MNDNFDFYLKTYHLPPIPYFVNRTLAQVLSVVFHPLLIPTYIFLVVLYLIPESVVTFPVEKRWIIVAVVFLATFLIPGAGTYFIYRSGLLTSMQAERREERSIPLFFTFLCFTITSYVFFQESFLDRLFFIIMSLITLSVFLTFVFSFFWKISAHGVGMGGALGILFFINAQLPESSLLHILVYFIIAAGGVASARLALQAHTPAEVYCGLFLGFSVGVGMWLAVAF